MFTTVPAPFKGAGTSQKTNEQLRIIISTRSWDQRNGKERAH